MYFIKYLKKNDFGQTEVATQENIMADALDRILQIISSRTMILLVEKQP